MSDIFDEQALRRDIVAKWGPAGAHVDVLDTMVRRIAELEAEICSQAAELNALDNVRSTLEDAGAIIGDESLWTAVERLIYQVAKARAEERETPNRWVRLRATSPSGKLLFVCLCCGIVSPAPLKRCVTFADPDEKWGCSTWSPDQRRAQEASGE